MRTGTPACRDERRRGELFRQRERVNGIDFVEVLSDGTLCVHFFGEVPAVRDEDHPDGLTPANVVVRGGRRIRDIRVVDIDVDTAGDPDRDDCLHVRLDRVGDFSTYQLCLVDVPGFDPRYACVDFGFKVDCPTDLDCAPASDCAPVPVPEPEINYLAKDYASFRRLMLDRLARHDARLARAPRARPRHHPGRAAGLRRRPPQLLPGRGRHRGLPRHRAPAHLGAPARAAGRLPPARGLQRARVGDRLDRLGHPAGAGGRPVLRHGLPGAGHPERAPGAAGGPGRRASGRLPRLRAGHLPSGR